MQIDRFKPCIFHALTNEDSIMNKGMFYCLPFLALTQVAASNALPRVEVTTLFKVAEVAEASDSTTVKAPKLTVANPISVCLPIFT